MDNLYLKIKTIPHILRNWIAYKTSWVTPYPVGYVICGITYACNSRCTTCNIWKLPASAAREIDSVVLLKRLAQSKLLKNIYTIDLTGGEPFLKPGLPSLVLGLFGLSNLKKITINTNGLATDRVAAFTKEILADMPPNKCFSISVSIDGIGETYDRIRGVKGGFEKVLLTLEALIELQKKYPQLELRSNAVIQSENLDETEEIAKLWREKKLKGDFSIVQNPFVIHLEDQKMNNFSFNEKQKGKLMNLFKKRIGFKKWLADPSSRPLSCFAGYAALYIDPYGDVYPCNYLGENKEYLMGNIKDLSIDEVWNSEQSWKIREKIKKCPFTRCWNGCEISQTLVQFNLFYYLVKLFSFGIIDYYQLKELR